VGNITPATLILALVCSGIAAVAVQHAVFRRLKLHHPGTFASLGEPKIFNPLSDGYGDPRVARFLGNRHHKALGDKHLSYLCDAWLVLFSTTVVLLLAVAYSSLR